MKRTYLIIAGVIALGAVLIFTSTLDEVVVFLLTGLLPGTTLAVPPALMLIFYVFTFGFIAQWAFRKQLYPQSPKVKAAKKRAKLQAAQVQRKKSVRKHAARQHPALPKHRYARASKEATQRSA